ncbi:hypothetical protein A5821_001168 [Enterococcus sp. 7F3_DIV0205]|uniref:Uncharacterized protein n=1 Tax=Candidatus Enterococcus palustris TaxID=1834189 RepID=A0AAQ3W7A9_9ENTE|nr:hypothetical protein [Enterococcus sp. 7F3_DIV0205]OTN85565.1 hypothetical protein A5821_001511 [Enterococcus sp. 7F3_DIV0205]
MTKENMAQTFFENRVKKNKLSNDQLKKAISLMKQKREMLELSIYIEEFEKEIQQQGAREINNDEICASIDGKQISNGKLNNSKFNKKYLIDFEVDFLSEEIYIDYDFEKLLQPKAA